MKVDSRLFEYKGNYHECSLKKIPLYRTIGLNTRYHDLSEYERDQLNIELVPLVIKNNTHIFQIKECRQNYLIAGYIFNRIDYLCYGWKGGY